MLKGFLSYAREDASDLSVDLERQFAELDGNGIVRFWIDRKLHTGDEWEPKLLRELSKADVVLVVVTPRAMEATSYVRTTELPLIAFYLRMRQLIVIPALAKKTHWMIAPLAGLQACPSPPWISNPTSQQDRTEWGHSVANAIHKALDRVELQTEVRREIGVAADRALQCLGEFEADLARTRPNLRQRAVVGTVRLLELIRSTVRAPAQDLLDDGPIAVKVAEKLHKAVTGEAVLERSALNLVASIDALVIEAAGLRFDFEVDNDAHVASALDWVRYQTELTAIEAAATSLQEEVQYIRQKRRLELSARRSDEIYSTIADYAERKSLVILGELEEKNADIELMARQSALISEMTSGFVNALAVEKNVSLQAVREKETQFISATQELHRVIVGARSAMTSSQSDDLKRIRGIGMLVEKKLNSLGVSRYDQVAAWGGDDIARISAVMDMRGRIERENWIEQARVLAAGGLTEFSRRVDRGEL